MDRPVGRLNTLTGENPVSETFPEKLYAKKLSERMIFILRLQ